MKAAGHRPSEGLCGLRNLAVVALPMVAMCDSRDISGVVDSKNLGTSSMILYDRYPGGLGYSEKGYTRDRDAAGHLSPDGRRVPVRRGLPQLRRTAQPAAGHPQRPGSDARLSDARTKRRRACCWNCSACSR